MAARQARARGVQHVLAPVVDVARDPRWGRIEETYGEDPYLVSRMGVAAVRGFQGRRGPDAPIDAAHVAATAKHFTGHGTPEGGRNTAPGNYSMHVLREVFFPPFEAVVREASIASVMPSYNEVDGIPSHAEPLAAGQTCCAASGGSPASRCPTTSASPSSSASTTWSPTCAPPAARRWTPASIWRCPRARATRR